MKIAVMSAYVKNLSLQYIYDSIWYLRIKQPYPGHVICKIESSSKFITSWVSNLKSNLSSLARPNTILNTMFSISSPSKLLRSTTSPDSAEFFSDFTNTLNSSLLRGANISAFEALSSCTVHTFLALRQYALYSEKAKPLLP